MCDAQLGSKSLLLLVELLGTKVVGARRASVHEVSCASDFFRRFFQGVCCALCFRVVVGVACASHAGAVGGGG